MYARVDVVALLFRVEQEAGELEAEVHVVRAAAPAPVGQGGRRRVDPVTPYIASTRLQLALTACFRHGVSDARRGNRISKRRLSIACKMRNSWSVLNLISDPFNIHHKTSETYRFVNGT